MKNNHIAHSRNRHFDVGRWVKYHVPAPSDSEVAEFIRRLTAVLTEAEINQIVRVANGNVQKALRQGELVSRCTMVAGISKSDAYPKITQKGTAI